MSSALVRPPKLVRTPYPALVLKTDPDGNDVAGVRLPRRDGVQRAEASLVGR